MSQKTHHQINWDQYQISFQDLLKFCQTDQSPDTVIQLENIKNCHGNQNHPGHRSQIPLQIFYRYFWIQKIKPKQKSKKIGHPDPDYVKEPQDCRTVQPQLILFFFRLIHLFFYTLFLRFSSIQLYFSCNTHFHQKRQLHIFIITSCFRINYIIHSFKMQANAPERK